MFDGYEKDQKEESTRHYDLQDLDALHNKNPTTEVSPRPASLLVSFTTYREINTTTIINNTGDPRPTKTKDGIESTGISKIENLLVKLIDSKNQEHTMQKQKSINKRRILSLSHIKGRYLAEIISPGVVIQNQRVSTLVVLKDLRCQNSQLGESLKHVDLQYALNALKLAKFERDNTESERSYATSSRRVDIKERTETNKHRAEYWRCSKPRFAVRHTLCRVADNSDFIDEIM
ncbi:hypothetical protein RF11_16406 [Thelohanellus kitauei]|uniref:Uncharacterized protein n=1 Tax=Thelohanellus kitauei TaxID=669202 RepID=A0A0C2M9C5_THEKT|nr:hypothetical protein RF11_16406 [Thelohanellus kitauei]